MSALVRVRASLNALSSKKRNRGPRSSKRPIGSFACEGLESRVFLAADPIYYTDYDGTEIRGDNDTPSDTSDDVQATGAISGSSGKAYADIGPGDEGNYKGDFTSSQTLTLTHLPEHTALHLTFTLNFLNCWDEDLPAPYNWGPDRFRVTAAGKSSEWQNLSSYVSDLNLDGETATLASPPTDGNCTFAGDGHMQFGFSFAHSGDSVTITFQNSNNVENQTGGAEEWGIDNLIVSRTPPDDCGCGDWSGGAADTGVDAKGAVSMFTEEFDGGVSGIGSGQSRSWSSEGSYDPQGIFGNGMVTSQLPEIASADADTVVVSSGESAVWFDLSGSVYTARFGAQAQLSHPTSEFILLDTDGGKTAFYDFGVTPAVLRGKFKSRTDAGGTTLTATYNGTTGQVTQMQQTVRLGGASSTETLDYSYISTGANTGKVSAVAVKRGPNQDTVRQVAYSYYDGTGSGNPYSGDAQAFGNFGDLQKAELKDATGNVLDTTYYRYYRPTPSQSGLTMGPGYSGGLKYVFGAEAYARMAAALTNPLTATDAEVAPYADAYYEYDAERRASKAVLRGTDEYTYTYSSSSFPKGYNSWQNKTVETLPEGATNTIYSNAYGQVMLRVHTSGTVKWGWFTKYDSSGRIALTAGPSAVALPSSLDTLEAYADLLNSQSGNYEYLWDAAGLVTEKTYGGSTTATDTSAGDVAGYYKSTTLKRGETATGGATALVHSVKYKVRTAAGDTIYPIAEDTVYDNADGTNARTTVYGFSWYDGTTRMKSRSATHPTVPAGQNGPDAATTSTEYFDRLGRNVFAQDEDGYVRYTQYDLATGAVVKTITDADTTVRQVDSYTPASVEVGDTFTLTAYSEDGQTSAAVSFTATAATVANVTAGLAAAWNNSANALHTAVTATDMGSYVKLEADAGGVAFYIVPSTVNVGGGANSQSLTGVVTADFNASVPTGLSSPSGTRLRLTNRQEVDLLGRVTKSTDPNGSVTYTVYNDADHEVRVYRGWTGTATTGPIEVTRQYRPAAGSGYLVYEERLTSSATPSVSAGVPTGGETFSTSNIQSLSREFTNPAGEKVAIDRFHTLGTTYSRDVAADGNGVPTEMWSLNDNYYRDGFFYGLRGRQVQTKNAVGTIRRAVFDSLGRITSEWIGTNDASASDADPTGGGASGNDMVKVADYQYDGGGVGDSNRTKSTLYPGGGAAARATIAYYDWRDRLVAQKQGDQGGAGELGSDVQRPIYYYDLDNQGRVLASYQYDGDQVALGADTTPADGVPDKPTGSKLRAKAETSYDAVGRSYQIRQFGVDLTDGTVSSGSLKSDTWYDKRGNVIKTREPGGLVHKYQYDGAGRLTKEFVSDGGSDAGWTDADDATGDKVLEQTEYTYDDDPSDGRNTLLVTLRQRFHDEAGTGELGTPSSGNKARVSYAARYFDTASRLIYDVDYGTNGATAVTSAPAVNTWPASALVTAYAYTNAGYTDTVTDPRGTVTKSFYDKAGRVTKVVEAYVDGSPDAASDRVTEYTYDGLDHVLTMKAVLPSSTFQTTQYVYGVTVGGGSDLTSNDLLREVQYPDKTSGSAGTAASDKNVYKYNALGQAKEMTDQNLTVHAYTYDAVGRFSNDAVTIASGNTQKVSTAILRLETSYDEAGRPYLFTSYDSASSPAVIKNQVKREFNALGQLTSEWQDHDSAVDSSSLRVRYTYSEDYANNHSRLTGTVYPDGRILAYGYASGLDASISRVSFLSDTNATSANLEQYSYLGLGTIVEWIRPQTGVRLTYVTQSTGTEPTGAGDQYTGLDPFGRVVDQRWRKTTGTPADVDRFKYGYDRDSNRLYKENTLSGTNSELYHADGASAGYDSLNRLTAFQRGALSDTNADGVYDTVSSENRYQSYTLDALGNWDSSSSGTSAGTATATARQHNRDNQITSYGGVTWTNTTYYDANGNQRKDENGKGLLYDAWNRLVGFDSNNDGDSVDTNDVTYSADALGRRVARGPHPGSATDLYYSSDWQVLEERVSGFVTNQYVWGMGYVDSLVLRDTPATTTTDASFDTDGIKTYNVGSTDVAYDVVVQPDGKILTAGSSGNDFALVRFNPDGSLDTSFDSDGVRVMDFSGGQADAFYGMALQPDGKIVAVGYTASKVAVLRYNPDGSLDTSFDSDGKLDIDVATGVDKAYDVVIDANGKIVLAGVSGSSMALVRLNADGSFDTSFDSDGKTTLSFGTGTGAAAVAIAPDGKIVAATTTSGGYGVARFNTNGSLDTSFDSDGKASMTVGSGTTSAEAVVVQPDGKVVVGGMAWFNDGVATPGYRFHIARFTSAGAADTSFDTDGVVVTSLYSGTDEHAFDLALSGDGRIVAAGQAHVVSGGDNRFAFARINPDGSIDGNFSNVIDLGGDDTAYAVALTPGGGVVMAGTSSGDFAVVRYGQRLFAQQDANFNVTSITDVNGAVQERYLYDPYGVVTYRSPTWGSQSSSYSWVYLHQGGRYDGSSKLYSFRNRDYSPMLGRWVQTDPAKYSDGSNLYEALRSNSVLRTDPLGMKSTTGITLDDYPWFTPQWANENGDWRYEGMTVVSWNRYEGPADLTCTKVPEGYLVTAQRPQWSVTIELDKHNSWIKRDGFYPAADTFNHEEYHYKLAAIYARMMTNKVSQLKITRVFKWKTQADNWIHSAYWRGPWEKAADAIIQPLWNRNRAQQKKYDDETTNGVVRTEQRRWQGIIDALDQSNP